MHRTTHWYLVAALALALVLGRAAAPAAAAEDATPKSAGSFADALGLPELAARVTDDAIEGLPAETAAGRYRLTVEVAAADGGGIGLLQLPGGMDIAGFQAALAESAETGGPPEWYFTTRLAGGTGGGPGQTAEVVVDLTPGEWIAWVADPTAPQPPVALTVTRDDASETPAEPIADVTLTLYEYGFTLEGEFAVGARTIAVKNVGAQPHHVFIAKAPEPVTEEQVRQILDLDMAGATPAPDAGLPNPDEFEPVFFTAEQSTGTTVWAPIDLTPGDYVLLCFVPDIASGMPHAMEGMYDVVTVSG